jgi:hypothetical protein
MVVGREDLNLRPLAYEPQKILSRPYSSLIYIHLVPRFSMLFRGVLFPTCSSICSQNLIAGIHDWKDALAIDR